MPHQLPNDAEQPDPQGTFAYDVFVAYSVVDAPWVHSTLVPQLHVGQVRVITSDIFELGAPKADEFERAVLHSGKTLLVLTPAALEDEWAEFAAILVHTLDPASRKRRFIPIIKEPCDLPLRFQGLVAFDTMGGADWERLIGAVRAPLPEPLPPAIPVLSIPDPAPLPPGSRMPLSHNPLFVGREEELRELARVLKAGDTAAIGQIAAATGLGGIGKTQLAAEFVHRYGQFFAGGVFWLSFAKTGAVPREVAACGGLSGMRLHTAFDQFPLDTQVQMVLAEWHRPLPRLLVFDNCEKEALLDQWRPTYGGCRVLITSRHAEWDASLGIHTFPLDVLSRPQSIMLLRSFRRDLAEDDTDLDAVADELGDLPLALHLAGSFLKQYQHDTTIAEYLDELHAATVIAHESLEGAGISPTKHELSVKKTFQLSYDTLNAKTPTDALALGILRRAAYFAPGEAIPGDLLRITLDLRSDTLYKKRRITDSQRRLVELGLAEEANGSLRLHRLIVAFVHLVAPDAAAQQIVEQTMLDTSDSLNAKGLPAPLLVVQPHLRHITKVACQRQDERAAKLCATLGDHLYILGDYEGARIYHAQALTIQQRVLGTEHPDTVASLNKVGEVLCLLGKYEPAQRYFKQALAIRKRRLGMKHQLTAESLDNLGIALHGRSMLEDAEKYYVQGLAIREQVLGMEHPDRAISLNNLGTLRFHQKELEEAQTYFEQALIIRERLPVDSYTAGILSNLGAILRNREVYEQAEKYYKQALDIYKLLLPKDHPVTATTLNGLGELLYKQGKVVEAKEYFEQALAIRERVLRVNDLDTARTLHNLGEVLRDQGDIGAQSYLKRAKNILEERFGSEYIDTPSGFIGL